MFIKMEIFLKREKTWTAVDTPPDNHNEEKELIERALTSIILCLDES